MIGQMVMSPISSAHLPYFMHRPELRVSHWGSCALTDIHRDITGRSQGHYQSGHLQFVFTDLTISWSLSSDGDKILQEFIHIIQF